MRCCTVRRGPTNATNGSFVITIFSSTLTGNVQNLQQLTLPAKKQFAVGPFLQATDGNLWDTSYVGGTSGLGIAFAITPSGGIVDTLSFSPAVGVSPIGGLIQAKDGTLFGTVPAGRRQTGRCTRSRGFHRSSEAGAGTVRRQQQPGALDCGAKEKAGPLGSG